VDTIVKSKITLGDDSQLKYLGKGIVYVLSKQNQKKDIHHVYYVPNLKHNMINVGELMEHGYDVLFKGSTCLILSKSHSRKLIAKIEMTKNKMFPLNPRSVNFSQSYAQIVSNTNETLLWHSRFGDFPFKSLSLLQKHAMVKGLPILNEIDIPCESCIPEKHKRDNFPTSSSRAKEHLELVHAILCGSMQTQSIGGSFFF
jgi:hypothetical protein